MPFSYIIALTLYNILDMLTILFYDIKESMFHNTLKFCGRRRNGRTAHMLMVSIKCFSTVKSYMNFPYISISMHGVRACCTYTQYGFQNRKIGIIDTIALSIMLDGTSFL